VGSLGDYEPGDLAFAPGVRLRLRFRSRSGCRTYPQTYRREGRGEVADRLSNASAQAKPVLFLGRLGRACSPGPAEPALKERLHEGGEARSVVEVTDLPDRLRLRRVGVDHVREAREPKPSSHGNAHL
jgi:hypothetical protein